MSRSSRMFDIIQLLRNAKTPLTAAAIGAHLEVTKRTIYRDIAALQAARVPIDGQAGIGYLLRPGYDLPPLNFTADEVEALAVGLALLGRTGDAGLQAAAVRARAKIGDALPKSERKAPEETWLFASEWHALKAANVSLTFLRETIRDNAALHLVYADGEGRETVRDILPLAVIFYIDAVVLAAWCRLRADFRHFRIDRMASCTLLGEEFTAEAEHLRRSWRERLDLP